MIKQWSKMWLHNQLVSIVHERYAIMYLAPVTTPITQGTPYTCMHKCIHLMRKGGWMWYWKFLFANLQCKSKIIWYHSTSVNATTTEITIARLIWPSLFYSAHAMALALYIDQQIYAQYLSYTALCNATALLCLASCSTFSSPSFLLLSLIVCMWTFIIAQMDWFLF